MLRIVAAIIIMMVGILALGESAPTLVKAGEPTFIDSDLDGCSDKEEMSTNARLGGQRNPQNPYDFLDVARLDIIGTDGLVDVIDLQAFAFAWGSSKGSLFYREGLDRTKIGPGPYDLGPPDGEITMIEIEAASTQYGHKCEGPDVEPALFCDINSQEAKLAGVKNYECQLGSDGSEPGVVDKTTFPKSIPPPEVDKPGESGGSVTSWEFWRWGSVVSGKPQGSPITVTVNTYTEAGDPPTEEQLAQLSPPAGVGETASDVPGGREPIRHRTCDIEIKSQAEFSFLGATITTVFEQLWLEVRFDYYIPYGAILEDSIYIRRSARAGWGHGYDNLESSYSWKSRDWKQIVTAHAEAQFHQSSWLGWFEFDQHTNQVEIEFNGFGDCDYWWDGDWTVVEL